MVAKFPPRSTVRFAMLVLYILNINMSIHIRLKVLIDRYKSRDSQIIEDFEYG